MVQKSPGWLSMLSYLAQPNRIESNRMGSDRETGKREGDRSESEPESKSESESEFESESESDEWLSKLRDSASASARIILHATKRHR